MDTSCYELTHWKRLWCWEGLRAGGDGDDRGWDGWMASLTRVWVNSGRWWWPARPGVLRFMGSQRVGHDWATELKWRNGQTVYFASSFQFEKKLLILNYYLVFCFQFLLTVSCFPDRWSSYLLLLEDASLTPISGRYMDFLVGSDGKASAYNVGDPGLIPGLGKSSGEGNGNPLQ